jgi:hypothetical protein
LAARRAIFERWLEERLLARAFPPLEAPSKDKATAAGFFLRVRVLLREGLGMAG